MPEVHTVRGGGGLSLHVREWGKRRGRPLLLIHGWSQSHLCWARQYDSPLAGEFRLVALDLRGHGMSEAPLEAAHYAGGRSWADDIAAVIAELDLDRPVLAGWSYGGYVICDYLRVHGASHIGGINFVAAAVSLGPQAFGRLIGRGFLDHFADASTPDLARNIEGMRGFLRACFEQPPGAAEFERALCWNMVVPAAVRQHLGAREIDSDEVLRGLGVPLLVTHGRKDRVVLPAMAEHVLGLCPQAQASWYDGVGHVPFMEDAPRFNCELAAFVRSIA